MRMISKLVTPVCCLICLHSSAFAQSTIPNALSSKGIVVSGECLTKVTQDRGSVTLGTSVVATTSREASEKTIKAHEMIKKSVKDLSLADFITETAEYSVQEECSYHEGKRRCQGFRAKLATRFETSDISRLGDIIAVGSDSNADEVSDLSVFASPNSLKLARESCLEVAMKNAASKALKLAAGAGVTLGKLQAVVEDTAENHHPRPLGASPRAFEAAAMSEKLSASPSIDAKPIELRVEITAQYSLD